jgi:hypothetical protein
MRTLAAIVLLTVVSPLVAWNNTGHMTVTKLAWDQLDAKERRAILDLLKNHPHWDRYFQTIAKPANVAEAEFTMGLASTWPDWLRGFAKSKDDEGKKIYLFHKGPRHYINWPFVNPRDAEQFKDNLPGTDPKDDVIKGINKVRDELKATDKFSPKYRAVSLCWLLHLAGDIHQPLHNIGFISKYSPQGDMGGNLFWVKDQGKPVRLHAYWDDLPGYEESYSAYAASFEKAVSNCALLTRPMFARDRFETELKQATPEEWSKAGYALAVDVGYRNGKLRGWIVAFGKDTEEQKAKAPELPADYRDAAMAVANRQLALAGHRLADLLREVARIENAK